ncbi:YrbL family protein [uncultured Gilliamella sp.]|jgi:PhoP regulatory network protein YrbL.|uniref:YrbL family protein n=1 Tax=uncultured Gilliamella sp. TaxID=1193505 RepID=UPI0025ED221F|nr:YrbL family protein [uncultured Gilliamella sp.]
MNNIIQLTDKDYISKGLHRKCYHHPDDANKCIKVNYNEGADEETNREIAYYKHLIKRNISWNALARYYGSVTTNFGEGQVFELIRDYNGKTASSLEKYLADEQLTEQYYVALVKSLKELKSALLKDRIITMTIKSKNILFQHLTPEQNRLIIIDNIGNSTFIPIANYISFFATAKIERTWQRFLTSLIRENQHNSLITRLINEVSQ